MVCVLRNMGRKVLICLHRGRKHSKYYGLLATSVSITRKVDALLDSDAMCRQSTLHFCGLQFPKLGSASLHDLHLHVS